MRDTLLATFAVGAFTAIAAISAANALGPRYLYGVPYLSLAFCLLVSYHHAAIGALGKHCATSLVPHISRHFGVLAYEHSNIYYQYHHKNATRRSFAHALILLLPAIVPLLVNANDLKPTSYAESPLFTAAWVVSVFLILISGGVLWRANRTFFTGMGHSGPLPSDSQFDALTDNQTNT
jgi:hypothetical protein